MAAICCRLFQSCSSGLSWEVIRSSISLTATSIFDSISWWRCEKQMTWFMERVYRFFCHLMTLVPTFLLKSSLLSMSCSLVTSCFMKSEFWSVESDKHTGNYRCMIFLCVLFTDLALLTSRLKSLVAEIKIILHILYVFHSLVHQLEADIFILIFSIFFHPMCVSCTLVTCTLPLMIPTLLSMFFCLSKAIEFCKDFSSGPCW